MIDRIENGGLNPAGWPSFPGKTKRWKQNFHLFSNRHPDPLSSPWYKTSSSSPPGCLSFLIRRSTITARLSATRFVCMLHFLFLVVLTFALCLMSNRLWQRYQINPFIMSGISNSFCKVGFVSVHSYFPWLLCGSWVGFRGTYWLLGSGNIIGCHLASLKCMPWCK